MATQTHRLAPENKLSSGTRLLSLYTLTLFVSATLLFLIQPMFAKMVLPILGGTPFMWNTCMVFFQASLLAGYGYSHLITTRLGVRHQAVLHMGLILVSLLALPIAVGWEKTSGVVW